MREKVIADADLFLRLQEAVMLLGRSTGSPFFVYRSKCEMAQGIPRKKRVGQ